ncbi:M28 family peptidase [Hymenobacter sp. BT175]|uniref:M28 family peptidase n=1 Tax=Hymenobacter translucens TaxID=2886507 RepID=UPI001D0EDE74|nr:M28 family peptidase [Hymenobacter translucens]MCC2545028.1 M28 family peptidase [Hymenobacter translucens]
MLALQAAAPLLAQPAGPADTLRLRRHLLALTSTPEPRNYRHLASLNQAADYIRNELQAAGARLQEQPYEVQGKTYRNVIASFGPEAGERLVVGAHYDVCGEQPGADDNGTGVAALLELARLLGGQKSIPCRIDLVAYTLEEPPFFRSKSMGSYVHAKSLHDAGVKVKGMVALEMLGYYDDRKGTQDYPLAPLKLIYGGRGNYVTVAQKFGNGRFGRQFARQYKAAAGLPVKRFKAPAWLPGIDFSDHLNYWQFDYSAVLLTDTAFYRNKHYHEPTDTLDRLDMRRLGLSVDALLAVVLAR